MTYAQAKRKFILFGGFCDDRSDACDHDCGSCADMDLLITNALDKADKYRWHDLRKNPDDLPKLKLDLLGVRENKGMHRKTAVAYSNNDWFDCIFNEIAEDVIAWKYVEPFAGGKYL